MMYLDYWVSPDGKSILRESIDEPLSYLVGVLVRSAAGSK